MINVGIIGYGYAGQVIHGQLIEKAEGLKLIGASSSKADRKAVLASKGLIAYASADALIADKQIDLVVVATPHNTHKPLTVQALKSGKHVVTDKMMCLNAAEGVDMIDTAMKSGKMLSVFQNRRWDGDFLTVKSYIESGKLGNLIALESQVYYSKRPSLDVWRASRANGGGIFSDWGAHLIDQALMLNPSKVTSVYCRMTYAIPDIDVESGAVCVLEFENGVSHTVSVSHLHHVNEKSMCVWGDSGRLDICGFDPKEDMLKQQVYGDVFDIPPYTGAFYAFGEKESVDVTPVGKWVNYYQNVADHLNQQKELAVKPEQALRMMQVHDAALNSIETKQIIDCEI